MATQRQGDDIAMRVVRILEVRQDVDTMRSYEYYWYDYHIEFFSSRLLLMLVQLGCNATGGDLPVNMQRNLSNSMEQTDNACWVKMMTK